MIRLQPFRLSATMLTLGLAAGSLPALQAQSAAPPPPATATAVPGADVTIYRGNPERTGYVDCNVNVPLSVSWQNTTVAVDGTTASPIIDGGALIFGSGGSVYALDATDGSIKWTYPKGAPLTSGSFHSPASVSGGKVFIGNDDGKLYVLDEKTGDGLWQVVTGGPVRSAPIVDDGTVFFGSLDTKLYAVRIDNQQPLWGGSFRSTGPIMNAPVISGGNIYFADTNNTLFCAVEATGRLIWSEKFDQGINDSPPLLADGTLIVGSDRSVYGLAPRAGAQKWRATLSQVVTTPASTAPDGNTIYVATSDGNVAAMTTRGVVRWTTKIDSAATAAPVVTRNLVVVATKSGVLTGLDPDSGAVKWVYSLHAITPPVPARYSDYGYVTATPLVAGGSIYVLGNDGTVTALKPTAVDSLPPSATLNYPPTSQAVAGAQVPYQVSVLDAGSGINPASVTLKVDGAKLPVEYKPGSDTIEVKQSASGQLFGTAPVKLPTIAGGAHTLTLSVSDWRGNRTDQSWQFTVDSSLNPPDAAPVAGTVSALDNGDNQASSDASPKPGVQAMASPQPEAAMAGAGGPLYGQGGAASGTRSSSVSGASHPAPSPAPPSHTGGSPSTNGSGNSSGTGMPPSPKPLPYPLPPPGASMPPPPPI